MEVISEAPAIQKLTDSVSSTGKESAKKNSPTRRRPRLGNSGRNAPQHQPEISPVSFGQVVHRWLDGSRPVLRAVRSLDYGDSLRHETIGGLFQEFLCPALPENLAALLFAALF